MVLEPVSAHEVERDEVAGGAAVDEAADRPPECGALDPVEPSCVRSDSRVGDREYVVLSFRRCSRRVVSRNERTEPRPVLSTRQRRCRRRWLGWDTHAALLRRSGRAWIGDVEWLEM